MIRALVSSREAGTRLAHESKAGHVVSTDAKSNTSEEKALETQTDPEDGWQEMSFLPAFFPNQFTRKFSV